MSKDPNIKAEWERVIKSCVEKVGAERGWSSEELFKDHPDLVVRITLAADEYVQQGTPDCFCDSLGITTDGLKEMLTSSLRLAMPTSNYA